jgi:hypothetical protein
MFWRRKKDEDRGLDRPRPSFSFDTPSPMSESVSDQSDEEELTAQEDLLSASEALKMTQDALVGIEQETAETADGYFDEIMANFNQTVQEEAEQGHHFVVLATSGEFEGAAEELEPAAARAWARVDQKLTAQGLKIEIVKHDGTEREYGNYELVARW